MSLFIIVRAPPEAVARATVTTRSSLAVTFFLKLRQPQTTYSGPFRTLAHTAQYSPNSPPHTALCHSLALAKKASLHNIPSKPLCPHIPTLQLALTTH